VGGRIVRWTLLVAVAVGLATASVELPGDASTVATAMAGTVVVPVPVQHVGFSGGAGQTDVGHAAQLPPGSPVGPSVRPSAARLGSLQGNTAVASPLSIAAATRGPSIAPTGAAPGAERTVLAVPGPSDLVLFRNTALSILPSGTRNDVDEPSVATRMRRCRWMEE
jgi:hypothetical protein